MNPNTLIVMRDPDNPSQRMMLKAVDCFQAGDMEMIVVEPVGMVTWDRPVESHDKRHQTAHVKLLGAAAFRERVKAYLQANGPTSCVRIAEGMGAVYNQVDSALRAKGVFYRDSTKRWRVVEPSPLTNGQPLPPVQRHSRAQNRTYTAPVVEAMVEYLKAHSPARTRDIALGVGGNQTNILKRLQNRTDLFIRDPSNREYWRLANDSEKLPVPPSSQDRVMQAVTLMKEAGGSMRNKDLASALGMDQSSCHRMLNGAPNFRKNPDRTYSLKEPAHGQETKAKA